MLGRTGFSIHQMLAQAFLSIPSTPMRMEPTGIGKLFFQILLNYNSLYPATLVMLTKLLRVVHQYL